MNKLIRKCLLLPFEQRQRLADIINESLKEPDKDDGKRFNLFLRIATEICGNGILSNSREFPLVMGRRMIAYQMKSEGFTNTTIGKHLAKHHASVIHMVNMMEDVIKFEFNLEMAYWMQFQRKLKEYETDNRTAQGS